MGLLSWLFGSSGSGSAGDRWSTSDNGNPTLSIGNQRLTVFPHQEGYKFCIARSDRDEDSPYYSELYATPNAAREEGLRYLNGEPLRQPSLTAGWRAERHQRASERIAAAALDLRSLAKGATGRSESDRASEGRAEGCFPIEKLGHHAVALIS